MSNAHIHLIVNHFTIVGSFLFFAMLVYAVVASKQEVYRVALVGFLVVSIFAVITFLSGEGAEELVEKLPGVSHKLIEEHEEWAEISLIVTIFSGAVAGVLLLVEKYRKILLTVLFLASLLQIATLTVTGNTGGKIRHEEIRSSFSLQELIESEAEERED